MRLSFRSYQPLVLALTGALALVGCGKDSKNTGTAPKPAEAQVNNAPVNRDDPAKCYQQIPSPESEGFVEVDTKDLVGRAQNDELDLVRSSTFVGVTTGGTAAAGNASFVESRLTNYEVGASGELTAVRPCDSFSAANYKSLEFTVAIPQSLVLPSTATARYNLVAKAAGEDADRAAEVIDSGSRSTDRTNACLSLEACESIRVLESQDRSIIAIVKTLPAVNVTQDGKQLKVINVSYLRSRYANEPGNPGNGNGGSNGNGTVNQGKKNKGQGKKVSGQGKKDKTKGQGKKDKTKGQGKKDKTKGQGKKDKTKGQGKKDKTKGQGKKDKTKNQGAKANPNANANSNTKANGNEGTKPPMTNVPTNGNGYPNNDGNAGLSMDDNSVSDEDI